MAKKISQLTQATQVKSDDVTVIVQDGETKKLPLNMMVTKQDIEDKKVAGLAKLDEIEATYENDTYTPTITVKNKSSVKVGEGDGADYSANVMDGHAKSAILKGCTKYTNDNGDVFDKFFTPIIVNWSSGYVDGDGTIADGGHYVTQFIDIAGFDGFNFGIDETRYAKIGFYDENKTFISRSMGSENGTHGIVMSQTFPPNTKYIRASFTTKNVYFKDFYNRDLTLPLSLSNVKMPVLTTTGKNLFNYKNYVGQNEGIVEVENGLRVTRWARSLPFINNLLPDTTYTSKSVVTVIEESVGATDTGPGKILIYNGTTYLTLFEVNGCEHTFTTPTNIKSYDRILFYAHGGGGSNTGVVDITNMQIEEGTTATSYEPYKTNILTVNEDVTLRSNGDICDELNLLTGQLTQRIDEDGEVLSQEVVKTVDLIPSGTHPSTTPYCWKDGHIQLSSSELLPSLEYSVVTSRAGQISQNAAMIVKNDKRIFDLEILLAGGLVNTTYQALTLQNQVETGLSKVSLSSEKEPDYLLYHMIMKLIEEKAYKLDDFTEKVSVFYLYEKLSDEQFETIYSELYPFVEEEYIELPEDGEIIEEPIVDEVLEEVENGVVM